MGRVCSARCEGRSVSHVRQDRRRPAAPNSGGPKRATPIRSYRSTRARRQAQAADIVLVGCVKRKLDQPAQARDLYVSPLFRKERAYAEATGLPWFILSAEHGLVAPTDVLEPYERALSRSPRSYRVQWGQDVVDQLIARLGPLRSVVIEIHAGAAYCDPIRELLISQGAEVLEPLSGRTLGQRLAWYGPRDAPSDRVERPTANPAQIAELIEQLGTDANAVTPEEFLASEDSDLNQPGLYSWWVDADGAHDLSAGLGLLVAPGLIYAGLADAAHARSGEKSTNTMRGRLRGMHLGGRHQFSTS